jgi:Domain of unknown function (DUF4386)
VFYVVTFVAIPALLLIGPVLDDPNYIVSDGVDSRILLGCVLDIVVALTCIGTGVALFPVLRRHNEASVRPSSVVISPDRSSYLPAARCGRTASPRAACCSPLPSSRRTPAQPA